jgi:hypothetical protein
MLRWENGKKGIKNEIKYLLGITNKLNWRVKYSG